MEKIKSIFIEGTHEVFDGLKEGYVEIQTENGNRLKFSIQDLKDLIEVYEGKQGTLSRFKNKMEYNPYQLCLFSTPDKRSMAFSSYDEEKDT